LAEERESFGIIVTEDGIRFRRIRDE